MAEVYLAEQPSLQRQVAVKVLRRELARQSDYVKRFHNEARAVAALVHANIVQIYEVGCEDGVHFIAQEYVPGQNVKQLVTRNGPLEIPRVISILRQMAAALIRAAQRNIVHRDIKPENILLSTGGEVKVADFGLARVMDPQNVDLTQAGLTMGTPLYMSPEQVEGRAIDHRSDLYSCGVTAFYMLVGRPPFQGDTPLSVAVQHLQNPPPALETLRPDAPQPLCAIVAKLLAKKPQDRYSSAADLLRELRLLPAAGWDADFPVEHDSLPGESPDAPGMPLDATQQLQHVMATQAIRPIRRRRRWLLPTLMALGVLLGAMAALTTWSGPLLAVSPEDLRQVDEQPTAREQYYNALYLNTEAGWRSVAKFHPPEASVTNRYYANRAKQQLAWFYYQRNEFPKAMVLYRQLAQLEDAEQEFRAVGLAGLVMIYDQRQQRDLVAQTLPSAMALRQWLEREQSEALDRISQQMLRDNSGT